MRKAFQMFDTTKSGFIETLKISTILNTMGQLFDDAELQNLIGETDPEGTSSHPETFRLQVLLGYLQSENSGAV
jgi:Ca2+-binding EF-hand superfamily protein